MKSGFKMESPERVRIRSENLNSGWSNPNLLGILVAIIAALITIIAFSLFRKSRTKKNGILLFGICEAGKTLIFSRLVYGKFVQTHTSVKENMGDYFSGSNTLKIIDIPGHERLRNRYFDQFKPIVKGLVFVIDSLSIQKDLKDVAEYLYHCLTEIALSRYKLPLLILCNKQGEATAKGCSVIKSLLEKELNILRRTQTNQLESIGNSTGNVFLGKEGKDFEFSHLSPMKIDFAECSAVVGQDTDDFNLTSLEKWIETLN